MIVTTQDTPAEYQVTSTLGLVQGNTVRSRNIFRNFIAGLRTIVGGEINEFTQVLTDAREEAFSRMQDAARELGADGIVGIRFQTAEVGDVCSEILVYGTAVKLKKSK